MGGTVAPLAQNHFQLIPGHILMALADSNPYGIAGHRETKTNKTWISRWLFHCTMKRNLQARLFAWIQSSVMDGNHFSYEVMSL